MFDQKRRENRKKILAFTPVYMQAPKTLLGYLGDLTVRGALVIGEKSVEMGKQVTLEIEFPQELPELGGKPVSVAARVARCNRDDSPQYFNIGVEFVNATSEQAAVFEAIIRRYEFRHDFPAK